MEQSTTQTIWQIDSAWRPTRAGEELTCRVRTGNTRASYCERPPVAATRRGNGTWAYCIQHLRAQHGRTIRKDGEGIRRVWSRS